MQTLSSSYGNPIWTPTRITTVLPRKNTEMADNKDVVVTGVSTGIGLGTTKVLVSKGFRVFGSVRKQPDADRLQAEFGERFVPLLMDITDADAVHQAAQKVGSMIGDSNLVGLVNNAGVVVSGPLLYLRPSEYRRQLEVNMISPLVVIQAFAPLLGTDKKRQGPTGRIVNISSTGAKVAIPLIGAYSSSKAGLEGMLDALRRELMLFGIDVVIIEPGTVNTAMYDKGEKEDLSEFKQTEYWKAVEKFQKFIVAEARNNGLSPERLGEAVHVALAMMSFAVGGKSYPSGESLYLTMFPVKLVYSFVYTG
jgi:NAD(P)-dependent dehydrogenase (short-subunit alcohol dehydrogenase family)